MGHFCSVPTAVKIQEHGAIKAQSGIFPDNNGNLRKNCACFFVDLTCLCSIVKGLRALRKHLRLMPRNTRWGLYSQRDDTRWEDHGVAFESVNGAHWVRASKSDVPSVLFDFHVVPPHLPCWAFTKAHTWDRPLAWWSALTNYEHFSRMAIEESKMLVETIDPSFCSSDLPMHCVVPFARRGGGVCFARASSNTKGVLVQDAKGLAKAHETLKVLCSEEHHQDVKDALELAGQTRALYKDCYDLLFSKPGERIGWGVDHNAVEWSLYGGSVAVQREVRGDLLAAAAAAREDSNDGAEMMTREESNDPGSENINERSGDDSDPGIVAFLYSLTPLFPYSHIPLLPYSLVPRILW